ncbi:MAG: hypothetical protein ACI9VL_000341, partial [Colwellia sp.]
MRINMNKVTLLSLTISMVLSTGALAKISVEQAAKLSTELTPLGAVRAGNKDGSIPAWTGGITKPPAGYTVGDHHLDPYPNDKVKFTITSSNIADYQTLLTPGQIKLFETYPDTYKMNVYQTHRSASYPEHVYQAVRDNATRSELIKEGNGIIQAAVGIPFPVPANGLEAIWNHTLRYRGESLTRNAGQAAPTASGSFTYVGLAESLLLPYSIKGASAEALEKSNILFKFKQKLTEPARLAGTALLVHETMDQIKTPRRAWTYNTGQRRV